MPRPRGAGNRKHRGTNARLGLKMAELRIRDPGLSVWQAARNVAPEAPDHDGDDSHQGKVPRRLHDFYIANALWLEATARRRLNPPRPRPSTLVEMANQMNEAARLAQQQIQDSPLLREEARIRAMLAQLKLPKLL
jgi:hypothetical protein